MTSSADHPSPTQQQSGPRRGYGWVVAPVIVFGALAMVFAFALKTGDPSKLPSALIGKPVPPTELKPLEGLTARSNAPVPSFKTGDLGHGRVSVVNFWASWCVPCVQEHPYLEALKQRAGVALYGINYKDANDNARHFIGRYGNPYDAIGVDEKGRSAIDWGVYGTPETFVIDGQGRIAYKHVGPITAQSLERQVLPAIEAARKAIAPAK